MCLLLATAAFAPAADTFKSPIVTGREWRLLSGRHWQIVAPGPIEEAAVTDRTEGTRGACAAGMVEVRGAMKMDDPMLGTVEELQKQTCVRWVSRDWPERCAEFDRAQWLVASKPLSTRSMHFCIDRYEFPNRRGAFPVVLVNWHEAAAECATQGKRLCSEAEWTFACEGDEAVPYPNGYTRDPDACLNDQPWRPVDEHAFAPRDGTKAVTELDRLWQGHASGARPKCRSPFGVYDLTGNVDEWTRSSREGERPSVLKGGYWGPVRTRCRPSTRAHDESFLFYQQSFRCCSAAP